jgi:hypothetical protein
MVQHIQMAALYEGLVSSKNKETTEERDVWKHVNIILAFI